MKRFIIILLVLLSFISNSQQLDTVKIECEYFGQYIYPPLIDNSLSRTTLRPEGLPPTFPVYQSFTTILLNENNTMKGTDGIAQRYEVEENDSVSLMGVAFMVNYYMGTQVFYDTITISVLSGDFETTYYSQTFVSTGITPEIANQYQQPEGYNGSNFPYVECLFYDTITLYGDYYVTYQNKGQCEHRYNLLPLFMCLHESAYPNGYMTNDCVPYSCSSKYKPYFKFCDSREWSYVDDITNWYVSYESVARYQNYGDVFTSNEIISACDTAVYMALGIMPIQTLRDTVSDTLNSGIVSVELLEECTELFPNPAKDVLNINSAYAIKEVEIYDALNRLVKRRKVNNKNIQIDISNLSAGSYVVEINTAKGSVKKKLIVE